MEAATRELAPGTMLDDKYRIENLLAVGGMGAVYVGTHTQLRKKVAIKILNPQLNSPGMIARFQREAITASQIGHEGIAQVTDLGTSRDGEAFLVMELLEGESLAHRLKNAGPMSIEQACELGCAILAPLYAAHQAGIVHRDLKPDNVFLVRQSRGELIKLLDFGISRAAGLDAEMRLTNTGVVMGTPFYMSPEQARGDHEVGPASDIYSFGVMLYEMLVGALPIKGDNYNQLIYRVMSGDYRRARERRPDIPQALDDIIAATMTLEAPMRPSNAAELEHALLAFCRPAFRDHMIQRISSAGIVFGTSPPHRNSNPSAVLNSGYGTDLSQGTDPTLMAPGTQPPLPRKKRSLVPYVLAGVLVLGGTAAYVVATQSKEEPKPASFQAKTEPAAAVEPPAVAPAPTPAPTPAPAPPAVETAPAKVTIKFAVEPKHAVITVDDKPIDNAELVIGKDDTEHTIKVTAPGFEPHTDTLKFDESQKIIIRLDRAAKATRTGKQTPTKQQPTKRERIDTESPY
ncbi:MAG TPA: serine/threonine-protein kinase [Kofleriaceae bacterium]